MRFLLVAPRAPRLVGYAAIAAFALSGCETIEEKYSPKHVSLPQSLTTEANANVQSNRALKPEGTLVASGDRPRDALTRPEFYMGTGVSLSDPQEPPSPPSAAGLDSVTLNFVETGILEVVDVVLGQTLGMNYVIDPRVQGAVTARTINPIPKSSLLPVLENILALNGAAMIRADGVLTIVPLELAPSLPKLVVTPNRHPQARGVGIFIIPLKYASVASVQDLLATQVSPGRQLAVDHLRNLLIYTGPSQEARSISELASVLDVDALSGKSFALLPVQSADAETVAEDLEAVFTRGSSGALKDVVQFVPIKRLNAVLAIAPQPAYLDRAAEWVERLDRSDAGAGDRVFVYYARNARAAELADVLNQVFNGGKGAAEQVRMRSQVAPGMRAVELIAPPVPSQNGAEPNGQETASEPRPTLSADLEGASVIRRVGDEGLNFVADERNNAVVVVATADEFRMVEATLRRLDILPLQVLIEATIAEVELNDDLRYGLQWAFESGDFNGSFSQDESGAVGPAFPGFNLVLDTSEVDVVLNALSEVTNVEVMSSPQLMVLDNQKARLQVGDQVPIATGQAVRDTDSGLFSDTQLIQTDVEYFDTGVILEVSPRVNASGLVTLDIVQEVSDADTTTTSGIDSPTIRQRRIESSVAVYSGETVALGGLIRERAEDGESGVPLLMDIPLVGNLFKTTSQSSRRTELLVLITPRVVRDRNEARDLTSELRERLSALRDVTEQPQPPAMN